MCFLLCCFLPFFHDLVLLCLCLLLLLLFFFIFSFVFFSFFMFFLFGTSSCSYHLLLLTCATLASLDFFPWLPWFLWFVCFLALSSLGFQWFLLIVWSLGLSVFCFLTVLLSSPSSSIVYVLQKRAFEPTRLPWNWIVLGKKPKNCAFLSLAQKLANRLFYLFGFCTHIWPPWCLTTSSKGANKQEKIHNETEKERNTENNKQTNKQRNK